MRAQGLVQHEGEANRANLATVMQWVLAAFDLAVHRANCGPKRLHRLHRSVSARADRWRASSAHHPAWRRYQFERLYALAPSAVGWLTHRADQGDTASWLVFRRHLSTRCLAIIRELPHAIVDEE